MKKRCKFLLAGAAAFGLVSLVNRAIFAFHGMRGAEARNGLRAFKTRFGDMRYAVVGLGKPMLLIHGLEPDSCSREWESQAARLSERFRVYSVDLLGFGYSDKPRTTYNAYLYSRLINDFIGRVVKEKVRAAARGGSCAFLAAACVFEPDNFNKLILVSPDFGTRPPAKINRARKAFFESAVLGTAAYILSVFKKRAKPCAYMGGRGAVYSSSARVFGFMDADAGRLLSRVRVPVKIINQNNGRVHNVR